MTEINQLGLGCMGMGRANAEKSARTIHAALDAGIKRYKNFQHGRILQGGRK